MIDGTANGTASAASHEKRSENDGDRSAQLTSLGENGQRCGVEGWAARVTLDLQTGCAAMTRGMGDWKSN